MESAHKKIFGKEPEEVVYLDVRCPDCGSRIDEFGFCGCGAGES